MRKLVVFLAVVILVFACGCSKPRKSFAQIADTFVYSSLAISPVGATAVGYHIDAGVPLDEMLDDVSEPAIQEHRRFYADFREYLRTQVKRESLPLEEQADYDIIQDQIALALLEFDTIQDYRHNPAMYVETVGSALNTPFLLEYAPKAQRYRHIISRLEKLPVYLRQAEKNLVNAPQVWIRVAQEENDGNIELVEKTLREQAPAELKVAYSEAAHDALVALRDFSGFLKYRLTAQGDWRLGKRVYAEKFRYVLQTDKSPEEMLSLAELKLARLREEMAALGKPLTVAAALDKIANKHATPETYLSQARADLAEATQFVREKKLLTMPPRQNLEIIETPEFMRGVYAVGGFNPAPALEPDLHAYYWVTPIPKTWPQDRVESKLREYNDYGLQILTIHEAMPGHYVQAEVAGTVEPKYRRVLRKVYGSGTYVEGWAVYATELMIGAGYHNDADMRLTFYKQMLRVVANTIMDIRLQTMGMTEQEALTLMMDQTYQEKEEATAKYQRAQLSSCQLPMYFSGWQSWRDVRDNAKRLSQMEFDDRALKEGAVPMRALSRLVAGQ